MYNFLVAKAPSTPDAAAEAARSISGRCLGLRTRMLDRAVASVFAAALRPTGIRNNQLSILAAVVAAREAGPAQLGRWLLLEKSTLSRSVDRMIEAGWLEPLATADGRSYRVRATAAGRAKLVEAERAWAQAQAEIEALVGPKLEAELRALARRLSEPSQPS